MDIKILTFINQNPVFKGLGLIFLSGLALLAVYFYRKKGRKIDFSMWVFTTVAVIILLYGIFVLIVQPQWWTPPQ